MTDLKDVSTTIATVVRPGDTVLIGVSNRPTLAELETMRRALEEIFQDVRFVVMHEVVSIVVKEGSDD